MDEQEERDVDRTCSRCGDDRAQGQLLVSDIVLWSERRSMGFLGRRARRVLDVLGGRGTHGGRPVAFWAERCDRCQWVLVPATSYCRHRMTAGWLFPQGALLWVAGHDPWERPHGGRSRDVARTASTRRFSCGRAGR